MCVCVCVCVCCHPIYSERQTCGRISRGHTGSLHLPSAVLALIFIARRIQLSLSLVDRGVYRILCTHKLIVLHLLGMIFFFFLARKNPSSCNCTEIRTHVPTPEGFGYQLNRRGDRLSMHRGIAKNLLVWNLRSTKGKVIENRCLWRLERRCLHILAGQRFDHPYNCKSIDFTIC